ncbi:glycoside hydrolase family 43 protein [Marmoricola sp. RAF53]|uniref:glycoside hydrolase family 43 protein n=1 Tax=Marmoricola sp. RAF53 TaxID=3233059 RepID=UPI003F9691E1
MRVASRVPSPLLVVLLTLGLTVGLTVGLLAGAEARPAPVGQDPVKPGQAYAGDFPDPAVMRVGATYYAYSTTSYGLNVPMLSSTDLRSWKAGPGTAANPSGDALPRTPVWSAGTEQKDGRFHATTWAPTVTRLGPGRYVLAYATQVNRPGQLMCISVATAASPYGPFVDRSAAPVLCPPRGAIDPQVFVAPNGRPWLVWKLDHHPAVLYTQPMTRTGTALVPGAPRRFLARIAQPWEGSIIENPAMIRYRNRYYLFYSANSYASTRYAVGYLICKTWYGGCTRPRKRPLLATGGAIAGPGGATPFVDTGGRLRLAYHAWTAGSVGYPSSSTCQQSATGCAQRRLYIAWVRPDRTGRLAVVQRRM